MQSPDATPILSGLRIIEVSAFVAAPLGGATLAELGADVIRIDPPGGGIDYGRWPLHDGRSLYWAGLNQGKRSVTIDLRQDAGRDLLLRLIAADSPDFEDGILLTNLGVPSWMSYERLCEVRRDLIMAVITGNPDGGTAVDYTVNAALGFPFVTGPEDAKGPVNHVLPAWDALTGYLTATAILAAERRRRVSGEGQLIQLSLADVGLSIAGHLGYIAEAQHGQRRPRLGNDLYGSFGRDFTTADGRSVMIIALTERQWASLGAATGLTAAFAALEERLGVDLRREGDRFSARRQICALIEPWAASQSLAAVREAFDSAGVLWGPYQTFEELVQSDPRCSIANPLFAQRELPEIGNSLVAGSPLRFSAAPPRPPSPAPRLGEHTDAVLREVAGFNDGEIDSLRAAHMID
jgi:2-methylfumaryl-CoA isomerase